VIRNLRYNNPIIYVVCVAAFSLLALSAIALGIAMTINASKTKAFANYLYYQTASLGTAFVSAKPTKSTAYYVGFTADALIAMQHEPNGERTLYRLADVTVTSETAVAAFLKRFTGAKLFIDLHSKVDGAGYQYVTVWTELPTSMNRQLLQAGLAALSQEAHTHHYNDVAVDYYGGLLKK
jgi:ethanolamine utilization microcompartment shell protein EutS